MIVEVRCCERHSMPKNEFCSWLTSTFCNFVFAPIVSKPCPWEPYPHNICDALEGLEPWDVVLFLSRGASQICRQFSWYLEPLVLIPQFVVLYRRRTYPFWVSAAFIQAGGAWGRRHNYTASSSTCTQIPERATFVNLSQAECRSLSCSSWVFAWYFVIIVKLSTWFPSCG